MTTGTPPRLVCVPVSAKSKMAAVSVTSLRTLGFLMRNQRIILMRLKSFQALGVHKAVVERLRNLGIQNPTEIQEKSLVSVSEGRNSIINAETGSGKTLCYLIPIVNRLLADQSLLTSPPHALILLPTVELCHQVAAVFKSIADPGMIPCVVHRESRLLINQSHPVVMAMPGSLLNYRLEILKNIQVVVTDEADFLTTSGGKDVWKVLDFLKYGEHLKKKRRCQGLWRKSNVEKATKKTDANNLVKTNEAQPSLKVNSKKQFIFVAATLPSRGKKASYNVLREWLPDAECISTSIVHQVLPSIEMEYVQVDEATKLPRLLGCLNSLAGLLEFGDSNTNNTYAQDSLTKCSETNCSHKDIETKQVKYPQHVGDVEVRSEADKLRVLVFASTANRASKAFEFLSGQVTEGSDQLEFEQQDFSGVPTKATSLNTSNDGPFDLLETSWTKTDDTNSWRRKCGELHGEVSLQQRLASLEKFKLGEIKVLICTDIASRGLDIPDVSHVIQLDFPTDAAQVLHRVGRTARAGARGKVINFITEKDEDLARVLRACDDDTNSNTYEAAFSRNRMFRRRMKEKKLPLAEKL